jgi:hypothetical protein
MRFNEAAREYKHRATFLTSIIAGIFGGSSPSCAIPARQGSDQPPKVQFWRTLLAGVAALVATATIPPPRCRAGLPTPPSSCRRRRAQRSTRASKATSARPVTRSSWTAALTARIRRLGGAHSRRGRSAARASTTASRFIFADDRKIDIEVGYGLEDKLPDAIASRIIREVMAPKLRAAIAMARIAGVDAVSRLIEGKPWIGTRPRRCNSAAEAVARA